MLSWSRTVKDRRMREREKWKLFNYGSTTSLHWAACHTGSRTGSNCLNYEHFITHKLSTEHWWTVVSSQCEVCLWVLDITCEFYFFYLSTLFVCFDFFHLYSLTVTVFPHHSEVARFSVIVYEQRLKLTHVLNDCTLNNSAGWMDKLCQEVVPACNSHKHTTFCPYSSQDTTC